MAKRLCAFIVIVALSAAGVWADEGSVAGTPYETYPSSLGYYTNSSGGVGLSWQHWYGNFGLAVAAGGLYNEDGSYPEVIAGYDKVIMDYSAQLRLSWILYSEEFSPWLSNNLHAVAYLAHRGITGLDFIEPTDVELEDPAYIERYQEQPYKPWFMAGAGVAVEATLFEHFSQTIDFMYVVKWPFELTPAVGYSLRYRY